MATHIIKYDQWNGEKLIKVKTWCGREIYRDSQIYFSDLNHYALSLAKGSIWALPACRNCVKVAMKLFKDELDGLHD